MSIVGSTPESGVRIDVARPREGGPPWHYAGEAVTASARFPLKATVSVEGGVVVDLPGEAAGEGAGSGTDGVAERVRLLLRAAYKHAREDGQPPPRRIVRWRAEVDLASPRRDG
jgi:hypothetical protein